MKVKAADIARKLNLSKATVSLALNHKPGVSEQTRKAIFQCVEEMEDGKSQEPKTRQIIKVIHVKHELNKHEEMDLWTDVLMRFDQEVRRMGYTLGVAYTSGDPEEMLQTFRETNEENVVGVICCMGDVVPEKLDILKEIKKPLVVYDNDAGEAYHCSVIGNMEAVRDSVDYLVSRGCHDIVYLGNSVDIYNFRERRAGYRAGLRKNRLELRDGSIVLVGKTTNEICDYMMGYLQTNRLPDAFIMDDYHVSIGVMRACKNLRISVPQDISLIGIDELPDFVMDEYRLTTVKVQHSERARALVLFLEQEIQGGLSSKFKVVSRCQRMPGNSVR